MFFRLLLQLNWMSIYLMQGGEQVGATSPDPLSENLCLKTWKNQTAQNESGKIIWTKPSWLLGSFTVDLQGCRGSSNLRTKLFSPKSWLEICWKFPRYPRCFYFKGGIESSRKNQWPNKGRFVFFFFWCPEMEASCFFFFFRKRVLLCSPSFGKIQLSFEIAEV